MQIPASDYEAHMTLPEVAQAQALGNLMAASLTTYLQKSNPESAPVTSTRYKSLERLSPIINLVSPKAFSNACASVGRQEMGSDTIPLKKGLDLELHTKP
jgi:hypothetical protein